MATHLIGDNIVVAVFIGTPHDGSLNWNGNPDPARVPIFGQSSGTGFNSVVDMTGLARRVSTNVNNQKISVKGLGQSDQRYRFTNYSGQMQIESFQTTSTVDPLSTAGDVVGNYVYVTLTPDNGTTQYYLGVIESFDTTAQAGDVCTINISIDLTPDYNA